MRRFPAHSVVLATSLLLFPTACGGSSGGGGDDGPPAQDDPKVEFALGSSSALETDGSVEIGVVLSEASEQEVRVSLQVLGTATEGMHFTLDAALVVIPPGEFEAEVTVDLLAAFAVFDENVKLKLRLAQPEGAEVGDQREHVLTIRNDRLHPELEASSYPFEPANHPPADPEQLGSTIAPGRNGTIEGAVLRAGDSLDPWDRYWLEADADTRVELRLTPTNPLAKMGLWIHDADGGWLDGFGGDVAGEVVVGQWDVVAGEPVQLNVWTAGPASGYGLEVVGSDPTVAADGGPATGRAGAWTAGAGWPTDLRRRGMLRRAGF